MFFKGTILAAIKIVLIFLYFLFFIFSSFIGISSSIPDGIVNIFFSKLLLLILLNLYIRCSLLKPILSVFSKMDMNFSLCLFFLTKISKSVLCMVITKGILYTSFNLLPSIIDGFNICVTIIWGEKSL